MSLITLLPPDIVSVSIQAEQLAEGVDIRLKWLGVKKEETPTNQEKEARKRRDTHKSERLNAINFQLSQQN